MGKTVRRLLDLSFPPGRCVFLWGPRRVGKSYWIRHQLLPGCDVRLIDLLHTDTFAEYASRPALLRERFDGRLTVIDEIQKIPALLDEVHALIEERRARFLLTGSSARKLRRGHANLLAGRARRHEMGPLSFTEVDGFSLENAILSGMLPPHFLSKEPSDDLRAYVADYLKEEIAAEAMVRNMPAFADFLRVAAQSSGELLNYTKVAQECGVSSKVVTGYFQILEDTLLGFRLAPWTRSRSRRMILAEKFYLFDVGVTNYLARRRPAPGTPEFGKSFEQFILGELLNYRRYCHPDLEIRYWRTSTGQEVDFILGDMETALEVKAGTRVHRGDLGGLEAIADDVKVKRRIVVCLEKDPRRLDGGIDIIPWKLFLERLYAGEVVS